jgi:hypothetical protein
VRAEERKKERKKEGTKERKKVHTPKEKLNVSKSEMVLAPCHITPLPDYNPVRTASTNM